LAGNDKELRAKALDAANKPPVVSGPPKSESTTITPKFEPSFSPNNFGSAPTPQVVTGFGGKPAPMPAPQPEL